MSKQTRIKLTEEKYEIDMIDKVKIRRPIDLNLTRIKFPITAISSILHRISGVILLFSVGIILWSLDISLSSPDGFLKLTSIINTYFFVKLLIWSILSTLAYHIISGIRYLFMDLGYITDSLTMGIIASKIVFIISIICSILAGVLVW